MFLSRIGKEVKFDCIGSWLWPFHLLSFTFSEFGRQQSLCQRRMDFGNPLGLILSIINVYTNIIKIVQMVQVLVPVSIFFFSIWTQAKPRAMTTYFNISKYSTGFKRVRVIKNCRILTSAKPSPMINSIWQFRQYQCICNILAKYKRFAFFRTGISAKPRPKINGIWQLLWIDLVNINVYAKCYQHITQSWRVRPSFSQFGPRQSLDQCHMFWAIPWTWYC